MFDSVSTEACCRSPCLHVGFLVERNIGVSHVPASLFVFRFLWFFEMWWLLIHCGLVVLHFLCGVSLRHGVEAS